MTGGIEETYDLKTLPNKQGFFDSLGNALAHDAMMVIRYINNPTLMIFNSNIYYKPKILLIIIY